MNERLRDLSDALGALSTNDLPFEAYQWMQEVTREIQRLSRAIDAAAAPVSDGREDGRDE